MMSNIIPFPKRSITADMGADLQVQKLPTVDTPHSAKLDFTCAVCQNKTSFQITSAVFKTMELFCAQCGTGWKVTNPVFKKTNTRKI